MTITIVSTQNVGAIAQDEIARRWASGPGHAVVTSREGEDVVDWVFLNPVARWYCRGDTTGEIVDSLTMFFAAIDQLSESGGHGIPYCAGFFSYEAGVIAWGSAPMTQGERIVPYGCCTLYQTILQCRPDRTVEYQVRYQGLPSCFQECIPTEEWPLKGDGHPRPMGTIAELVEQFGSLNAAEFRDAVVGVQESIRRGDVYQVNLSVRLALPTSAPSLTDLGVRFLTSDRADRRALISVDGTLLLSASPELFYEQKGDSIRCSPIKGTRPRVGIPEIDVGQVEDLCGSAKEQAELAMIVDLVRNDLNRLCVPGSVVVERHARVEAHHSVFHTVTDVRGTVEPGMTLEHTWRSLFPCGSITGAPKRSTIAHISRLEPHLRDAYCGSIGMFGLDRTAHWNVAIRTVVATAATTYLYAGSGITIDSDPQEELSEVLTKFKPSLSTVFGGGCAE